MKDLRCSGILFHPTSLPGPYGIGTLGSEAFRFVDFLFKADQKIWQILPLGPTGYGDSPYQCFSSAAGNPLLIDLPTLEKEGLLMAEDLAGAPEFDGQNVEFGKVIDFKMPLLRKAHERFAQAEQQLKEAMSQFCAQSAAWLDDYALFMALKNHHQGKAWTSWAPELVARQNEALEQKRQELANEIDFQKFMQFVFFRQWNKVKEYANEKGLQIVGDIPIYVAYDSADTWANPEIFDMDENRQPRSVAGVPPDYFSKTGQLWGNPLYDWEKLQQAGFQWWIDRVKANLAVCDIVRIDHFRGLEAFWAVPFGEETAIKGKWMKAKGREMIEALTQALPEVFIIAEDLGVMTPAVEALRDDFGLPGMKILQFAFDEEEENEYLPHSYPRNCIVYTGTHDNDTVVGWYEKTTEANRQKLRDYLDVNGEHVHAALIKAAWRSVANIAITPMQDLLGMGTQARMNTPGLASGNWQWRVGAESINDNLAGALKHITHLYDRSTRKEPKPKKKEAEVDTIE